ncbi:hypothetical protein QZM69_22320 [Burkholderia aenigmatica]|nr:hypothetical protein [Burkholderia aenigmatica]MDN7878172.1 hypothetical protein [Burkholderia aenigmatica]
MDDRHAGLTVAPNGLTGHAIFSEPVTGSEYRTRVRDHVQIAHRPVGIRTLSGAVGLPDRVRAAFAAVARHRVDSGSRSGIVAGRTDPRHRPGASSGRAESLGHRSMHEQRHRQGVQLNMTDADGALPVPRGSKRVGVRRYEPSSIASTAWRQAARRGVSIGCPTSMTRLPSM